MREMRDREKAAILQRFFKTGPGEYGEGDVFLGIRVPELRKLSRKYKDAGLELLEALLASSIHEERMLSLLILVLRYKKGDEKEKKRIHDLYMKNLGRVNNWDLVDGSAPHLVGDFLWDKDRKPIHDLAGSDVLWERRIAIMATFHFIKKNEFADALEISEALLSDGEDLIHKAVGWMLREIGKRDQAVEESFLRPHYKEMPRTMLRYAIEKFPEPLRRRYLKGEV